MLRLHTENKPPKCPTSLYVGVDVCVCKPNLVNGFGPRLLLGIPKVGEKQCAWRRKREKKNKVCGLLYSKRSLKKYKSAQAYFF